MILKREGVHVSGGGYGRMTAALRKMDLFSQFLLMEPGLLVKASVLAYRCLDQTAPSYLQTVISPYTPTRHLRSSCTRRLALPPLHSPASRAHSFSTLAPTDVRIAQSLTTFRHLLKTHLFRQHL
ncbi:UNVERIFIED_CONTAM: hypothetical protein FKN15_003801 [Acipenser sinensis]